MSADRPYTLSPQGVRLSVRLTPRSRRSACDGIMRDAEGRAHLQVRVQAPPADGAANAALIALIAKELSIRPSAVSISSGHASRLKLLEIDCDASDLLARLDTLLG